MPFMGKTTLYDAAFAGNVKAVQKLGARTDVDAWNRDGVTALHIAVRQNHVKVVEALVQLGADPDKPSQPPLGVTALHIAVRLNHVKVVEALVQLGADPNKPSQTNSGSTPLQAAAFYGKADAVACLVRLGANVYSRGRHGRTALHLSAARGHIDVVHCLLGSGMDPNVVSDVGETPLHSALQGTRHDEVVALLLHHADAAPQHPHAGTPQHVKVPLAETPPSLGLPDPALDTTHSALGSTCGGVSVEPACVALLLHHADAAPQHPHAGTPQHVELPLAETPPSLGLPDPALDTTHSALGSTCGGVSVEPAAGVPGLSAVLCVCGVAEVCAQAQAADGRSRRMQGLVSALQAGEGVPDVTAEVGAARTALTEAMSAVRHDMQSTAAVQQRDAAYAAHVGAAQAALAYLAGAAAEDDVRLAQASSSVDAAALPAGTHTDDAAQAVEAAETACAASAAALEAYACAWEAVGAAVRKLGDPESVAQCVVDVGAARDALVAAHAASAVQCDGLERAAAAAVREGEARVRSARAGRDLLQRVVAEAAERPDKATLAQRLQELSKQVVSAEDELDDSERAVKRALRHGERPAGPQETVRAARRVLSRAQSALEQQERAVAEAAVRFYPELAGAEGVREWGGLVCRRHLRDYTERELLAQSRHAVWRARRPDGEVCVLKHFATDKGGVSRLLREARALQRLQHPCVAEVVCVFQDEADWFMEMPYYSGGDLAAAMRGGAGRQAVLRMLHDAAQGLACIHRNGLVHCDVKPENVFIGADGVGRLGDFDVSKDTALRMATATVAPGAMTMAGGARGTRGYMAPEVVRGGAASCASDVYSLGLMVYDVVATVDRGDGTDGAIPAVSTDTVPAQAVVLLQRMLAERPEARPSAEEVVAHTLLRSGSQGDATNTQTSTTAPATIPSTATAAPVAWANRHARGEVVDVTGVLREVMQSMVSKSCDVGALGQGRNNRKGEAHKGLRVECVLRVEHVDLWESYQLQRRQMQARAATGTTSPVDPLCAVEGGGLGTELLSRAVNEVHLFHGTLRKWSDLIVSQGMDERVCTWGLHGAGLYFAENSSKSDEYMSPAEDGLCDLLVCRVLLGSPHLRFEKAGSSAQAARRPPCVQGHINCKEGHDSTDSVLAAVQDSPREFVVYDRARVYPEYIVKVRRTEEVLATLLS